MADDYGDSVNQKTRELGMRIAPGVGTADILGLVLSRDFALVAIAIVIGAGVSLEMTRLFGTLLCKVHPYDLAAFGSAVLVMSLTALLARLLPRATCSKD